MEPVRRESNMEAPGMSVTHALPANARAQACRWFIPAPTPQLSQRDTLGCDRQSDSVSN